MVFRFYGLTEIRINGFTFIGPDGEIGRRTAFRWQRSQGCAGSNPVLGTQIISPGNNLRQGFFLVGSATENYFSKTLLF